MRVAFVGVKRKYQELDPDYRLPFTQYHLELPYYYARDGHMDVTVATVDYDDRGGISLPGSDSGLSHFLEEDFVRTPEKFDVVVHWRKWFPELYRPEAINVINCQDHSFSPEWKASVIKAYAEKKLYGILCFPKWHKTNLWKELDGNIDGDRLIDGLTLGVDTDIYTPAPDKDPYQLLWASDPGRGLSGCLQLFLNLYRIDQRFKLNVCWPDYCAFGIPFRHPGINWVGNVPNGPGLWELFNRCGILPYTSTFKEPSSRAHRQAQAAGSLVLYPSNMGTPSDLIVQAQTGVVSPPFTWADEIIRAVESGMWKEIGDNARRYAISENWAVQAKRFREYFERIVR